MYVCNFVLLDKNTWSHITVYEKKIVINNLNKWINKLSETNKKWMQRKMKIEIAKIIIGYSK